MNTLFSVGVVAVRMATGRAGDADQREILPVTSQWDLVSNLHELAKGGWAGQLLYVNRDKDMVVAYSGTN